MEVHDVMHIAAEAYGKNFRLEKPEARREPPAKTETANTAPAQEEGKERTSALTRIVEPVERFMSSIGVEIKFNVNDETGEMQAEVRDSSGEKVIRKIPSDEVLRLAASIKEMSDHFLNKAL